MTDQDRIRELLTPREYEIYDLRQRNFSLRQTSHALNISISTVRSTIERIERKLRKAA